MARTSEHAERRRQELAVMLSQHQSVSTIEVARHFGVNPMTIRRDLKVLEDSGLVVRCYGGAVSAQRITLEFTFDERHRQHLKEKCRIGKVAAERIEAGQTVFLDTGTTTLEVARALARRVIPCQIVTSSLVIASELWGNEAIELLILGGRARRGSPDLVGPGTELMLDRLTADVAILGCDGVDPARGCFAQDVEAARVAERMVAHANRVVVVADHSKLGTAGRAKYVKMSGVDELITSRGAARAIVAALREAAVTVTVTVA